MYLNLEINIIDINIFILKSIHEDVIYAYLTYLNYYRNNIASTRQRRLEAIRSFYKYMYKYYPEFRTEKNIIDNVPKVQQVYRLPKYLTLEQAKQIQNVFTKNNCKYPERNTAIIVTFLNTGLRISELISLNISKIDFNNLLCKVKRKGGVERTVYFNSYCIDKINAYLKTRTDSNDVLFLSNQNKRISNCSVENICKQAYSLIGITDISNYSAHTLRHTAASIVYANTKDILLTKEFLRSY